MLKKLYGLTVFIVLLVMLSACGQKVNIEPQIQYFSEFSIGEYESANEFIADELSTIYNKSQPLSEEDTQRYIGLYEVYIEVEDFYILYKKYQVDFAAAIKYDDFDTMATLEKNVAILKEQWSNIRFKLAGYGWKYNES